MISSANQTQATTYPVDSIQIYSPCNVTMDLNCVSPHTSSYNASLNTSATLECPLPPYPPIPTGFLAVIAGITSLGTVTGNVLVVLAFILEKNLRQPSNYLIASLAVTDILIGLLSMPLYTLYLLKNCWPLGRVLCDLWLSLDFTVCLVSQYTVFLITLDRFCSVKAPAKYRNWRTTCKIKIMIVVTWLVPALIFFTSILGWHQFTGLKPDSELTCAAQFMDDPVFTAVLVICYYWVTLVIMTGLYIGIYKVALSLHLKARAKRKRIKAMRNNFGHNIYDLQPLNNQGAYEMKHPSNGILKSQKEKQKSKASNSESSHHQEDSDLSNEHSSDGVPAKRYESSSSSTTNQYSKKAPPCVSMATGSPLWKPRNSLPPASINWDAFSDDTFSTSQKEDTIIEESTAYSTTNDADKDIDDNLDGNKETKVKLLDNIGKVLSNMNHNIKIRKRNGKTSPKTKSRSENRAHKALRTITFILGAFVLCWTPYHVVILIDAYCRSKNQVCVNSKFYEFTYWLCYMNSPLNPFCYAFSNQQFKQAFIRIITGEYFRKNQVKCCKR